MKLRIEELEQENEWLLNKIASLEELLNNHSQQQNKIPTSLSNEFHILAKQFSNKLNPPKKLSNIWEAWLSNTSANSGISKWEIKKGFRKIVDNLVTPAWEFCVYHAYEEPKIDKSLYDYLHSRPLIELE